MTPWPFRLPAVAAWLAAAAALAVMLLVLARGAGVHWDPLGLTSRRLEAAQRRAASAEAGLAARRLEVTAAADQARRVAEHHQQAVAVERATATGQAQARSAHDALEPLDQDRAARLRADDDELCRLAPDLCFAAPAGPAGGGANRLSAGSAAERPDPG